jgi:hypothetical protein
LRLGSHNPRAQPSERGDAITYMCTNVKHEIARLHEATVKAIHSHCAKAIAIVDIKRSGDTAYGS